MDRGEESRVSEVLEKKGAVVLEKRALTPEVTELILRPDRLEGERFLPGQHLWIEIDSQTRRPYSIASPPSLRWALSLCFNRVPHGPVSNYLSDLTVGDRIAYTGPAGSFGLRNDSARDLLFIGTGTGLSPLRSMILDALERRLQRRITLVFGTRRMEDLLYPEEFHHLESHFANFRYHPCLSRFGDEAWTGLRGRVTVVLPQLFENLKGHEAYLCGRDEMIRDATELILRLGCDRESILREGG